MWLKKKLQKIFLRKVSPLLGKRTPRKTRLTHQGEHYNVKNLYDKINHQYFEGKLDLPITWSGNKTSIARTKIVFGSYNQRTQLIKIHRRLDQPHIPEHFISFIIYHEMLHHVLPPILQKNRRRKIHHRTFKEREQQFQEYALAKSFREQLRMFHFSKNAYENKKGILQKTLR